MILIKRENYGNPDGRGGLRPWNPDGRGGLAVLEIRVEGGSKKHAICRGGVDFFWNNPMLIFLSKNSACNSCKPNEKTNIAFMGEGGALIVMLLPTC